MPNEPDEWHRVTESETDALRLGIVGEDVLVHYENGAAVRICGCHDGWRRKLDEEGFDSRALIQALAYCDRVECDGDVASTRFPSYTPTVDSVEQFCRSCEEATAQTIRLGMVRYSRAECSSLKTKCKECGKKYNLEIEVCDACGLYAVEEPTRQGYVCSRCGFLWTSFE